MPNYNFHLNKIWVGNSTLSLSEISGSPIIKAWKLKWMFLLFALGIFTFFKGFQWFRLKRLIEDIPTSKIRSIAMGLVEIAGRALPYKDEILISPITKQKCLFYMFVVEGYIMRMDEGIMSKS